MKLADPAPPAPLPLSTSAQLRRLLHTRVLAARDLFGKHARQSTDRVAECQTRLATARLRRDTFMADRVDPPDGRR